MPGGWGERKLEFERENDLIYTYPVPMWGTWTMHYVNTVGTSTDDTNTAHRRPSGPFGVVNRACIYIPSPSRSFPLSSKVSCCCEALQDAPDPSAGAQRLSWPLFMSNHRRGHMLGGKE